MLDDLALLDVHDIDRSDSDRFPGWWDAHEITAVRPAHHDAGDYPVPFTKGIEDLVMDIRKRVEEHPEYAERAGSVQFRIAIELQPVVWREHVRDGIHLLAVECGKVVTMTDLFSSTDMAGPPFIDEIANRHRVV